MIEGLKPYPAYKDSGVPWIGRVPEGWETHRNGRLFVQRVQPGSEDLPVLEVSIKTGVRVRSLTDGRKQMMSDRSKYKRAQAGDIAYNMMRMWQGAVGVAPANGLVSPAYVVAQPLPGVEGKFFEHLFRTETYMREVDRHSRGIVADRNRLYWEDFKQIVSLVPPREEQPLIVRFLSHADRLIQRYIREKRKLIALLNEQKQATIHRAVTRGLDPSVRMKDSGVPWIGEVPAHWEIVSLKRVLRRVDQGVSPQAENHAASGSSWGVLKAGCVNGGIFREEQNKRLPTTFAIDPTIIVRPGDLLVSRASGSTKFVGSAAIVGQISTNLILSDKTFRLVFDAPKCSRFVELAMNSRYWRIQVERDLSGAGGLAANLPLSSLRDFNIAIPPIDEGHTIASQIGNEIERVHRSISATEREIAFLREYRARLIADVVTGQLDVREAAARLPDLPSDDAPSDTDDLDTDTDDPDTDAGDDAAG